MRAGPVLPIVIAGIVLAACSDQQSNTPTSPDFRTGGSGCSYSQIKQDVAAEWPNSAGADTKATNASVGALVTTMQQNAADSNIATATGFQILDTLANQTAKNEAGTTPAAGAQLALDLFLCMDVPQSAVPSSSDLVSALGPNGAFAVRNRSASDNLPVASHDLGWNVAPVAPNNWSQVAARDPSTASGGASAHLDPNVKGLFLLVGEPAASNGFTNSGDQLLNQAVLVNNPVFNWGTAPTQVFKTSGGSPGIEISQCDITPTGELSTYVPGFVQHNSAGSNPEVLGFVSPNCPASTTWTAGIQRRAPTSLAQRLWQVVTPELAHALVLGGGSGSKGSALSPWGVINPGHANLVFDPKSLYKAANQVGQPLKDNKGNLLQVKVISDGGTPFKQATVFAWIEATNNQGTNVLVCNNWAYTNDQGVALFQNAYLNKAGGYNLTFRTVGTAANNSAPGTPRTPAGQQPTSALFNVKNGTVPNDNGCSTSSPINAFVFNPNLSADQQSLPPNDQGPPPLPLP